MCVCGTYYVKSFGIWNQSAETVSEEIYYYFWGWGLIKLHIINKWANNFIYIIRLNDDTCNVSRVPILATKLKFYSQVKVQLRNYRPFELHIELRTLFDRPIYVRAEKLMEELKGIS